MRLSAKAASEAHHQELIRREQREERIRALMRELAHRSKNLLSVVEAIARQTASSSAHVVDYVRRLSARIRGLSDTHDLIADEDWKGARLDDLAARHMARFLDEEDQRISYSGPAVVLNQQTSWRSLGVKKADHHQPRSFTKASDTPCWLAWLPMPFKARPRLPLAPRGFRGI